MRGYLAQVDLRLRGGGQIAAWGKSPAKARVSVRGMLLLDKVLSQMEITGIFRGTATGLFRLCVKIVHLQVASQSLLIHRYRTR